MTICYGVNEFLRLNQLFVKTDNRLEIHCLGATEQEFSDTERFKKAFHPLFVDIVAAISTKGSDGTRFSPKRAALNIVLIGPELLEAGTSLSSSGVEANSRAIHFDSVGDNVAGLDISLELHRCFYHDYLAYRRHQADIVFLLNAGLWGYDSWIPTLRRLSEVAGVSAPVPVVLTSYTFEESEDDFDIVEEHCNCEGKESGSGARVHWLAESKVNPLLFEQYREELGDTSPDAGLMLDSETYRRYCGHFSRERIAEFRLGAGRHVGGVLRTYLPNYFLQCFTIHPAPVTTGEL